MVAMYCPLRSFAPFIASRKVKSGISKNFISWNTVKSITCNAAFPVALPITVKIAATAYPARIPIIKGISLSIFLP